MGRILGRVEYGQGEEPRYFIHCDTVDASFSPLFGRAEAAWAAYDSDGIDGLCAAVPKQNFAIHVIRKSLAFGRAFPATGATYGEARFGLATKDRLLTPTSSYDRWTSFLTTADGVMHVAERADGGMAGHYDEPICADDPRWPIAGDQSHNLEEFFGKTLHLCSECVRKLTRP